MKNLKKEQLWRKFRKFIFSLTLEEYIKRQTIPFNLSYYNELWQSNIPFWYWKDLKEWLPIWTTAKKNLDDLLSR